MPRLPRVQIKGALYYITCRGEHNERIFRDDGDYQMFLGLLKKCREQQGFKLYSYALIPDHLHLLIELREAGISEIMHSINSNYTKYFNGRYKRKGHLFRERFKAALVEKEPYLLKIIAYIHLNPARLNLISDALNYPYSSYCLYINRGKTEPIDLKNEIDEVMGYLKENDYSAIVKALTEEEALGLHKNLHRGGIVGSEEFVRKVKEEAQHYKKEAGAVSPDKLSPSAKIGVVGLAVILIGAGAFYFLRIQQNKLPAIETNKKDDAIIMQVGDLTTTEYQIRLTPVSGGQEIIDTLTFLEDKFISAKLDSLSYPASHYSLVVEDTGKVVWETMQTGLDGATASWRGEIEQGKMKGILSLRQKDSQPQDFSFVSVGYRRKK